MTTVVYMIFLYHLGGHLQNLNRLVSSIDPALSENSGQVSFFNQAMKMETVREMNMLKLYAFCCNYWHKVFLVQCIHLFPNTLHVRHDDKLSLCLLSL